MLTPWHGNSLWKQCITIFQMQVGCQFKILLYALKKWGKHSTASLVFPYTSFALYRFLRALQQNRAQSRLLYLLNNSQPFMKRIYRSLTSVLSYSLPLQCPRGLFPEKLGGGVWPASQNPYPTYDQNLRYSIPYLWPVQKFQTLFMTWLIKTLFLTSIMTRSLVQTNFKLP